MPPINRHECVSETLARNLGYSDDPSDGPSPPPTRRGYTDDIDMAENELEGGGVDAFDDEGPEAEVVMTKRHGCFHLRRGCLLIGIAVLIVAVVAGITLSAKGGAKKSSSSGNTGDPRQKAASVQVGDSAAPSTFPSMFPSMSPSYYDSNEPSLEPSMSPSYYDSNEPSMSPSYYDSSEPSMEPSYIISGVPSGIPSGPPVNGKVEHHFP